jgi:hypothetical protein
LLVSEFSDTHTHSHTLGRTLLDVGSTRRRDLYLTAHNSQQTSLPSAGFEPAIPASERRQIDALDGATIGMDEAGCTRARVIVHSTASRGK